jgi:nicotinate-nucleotide adenylyltransferase
MNKTKISKQVKTTMSKKRFAHTLRVTRLAIEIAKKVAPELVDKIFIAAMYHDVGKEFSDIQTTKLVKKWNKRRYPTPHTLHGEAGAIYVKNKFGIIDKQVLTAIANHVIPPKNADILSMIIYCADKLEPARTKDDVSNRMYYVKLAKNNLKQCFNELRVETMGKYN